MQQKILSGIFVLVIGLLIVGNNVVFAAPNPNLELIPEITINGTSFTLQNVPHDQASTLNYVNIPIDLGDYEAPVTINMQNGSSDIEYVTWHIDSCSDVLATSKYYIEPAGLTTVTRTTDEVITEEYINYYESEDGYDFDATVELTTPNCYYVTMGGIDEQTQDSNSYGNIYFTVAASTGHLEPDFTMAFDHSDVTIFDESLNETPMVLAPEFITLSDDTSSVGGVTTTNYNWTIEWSDQIGGDKGSAVLPIPTSDKTSSGFSYNFNNPGSYLITLEATGSNGLVYSTSKWAVVHSAFDYFSNVTSQRDQEQKSFTSFTATVAAITDTTLSGLYNTVLTECSTVYTAFDANSGGWGMDCTPNALSLMELYDNGLQYLNVPCSHFPDLSGSNSHDELCRAANVVKEIDAFEGDGSGSPTEGYLRPDDNINRAEICAILNKSKISTGGGTAVPPTVTNSAYSDLQSLTNDDWRKTNAAGCTQFEGYPDGTFRPDSNINSVETLKVLFLIYGETVDASNAQNITTYCPNISSGEWYSKYLALAFENGFMDVVADNCNPAKDLTRGEVVMLMYRMFFEYEYIPLP